MHHLPRRPESAQCCLTCNTGLQTACVQVVEALEETRTQLILVTEPIFASAADLLARFQTLPPAAAQARENTKLSELEIKAGLLQVIRPSRTFS